MHKQPPRTKRPTAFAARPFPHFRQWLRQRRRQWPHQRRHLRRHHQPWQRLLAACALQRRRSAWIVGSDFASAQA